MVASDDLRAFIVAFEEAWDEVVRGVPVSIDLYRFREAFARKMLTLAEQQGAEAADVPPAHHGPGDGTQASGRLLNELV